MIHGLGRLQCGGHSRDYESMNQKQNHIKALEILIRACTWPSAKASTGLQQTWHRSLPLHVLLLTTVGLHCTHLRRLVVHGHNGLFAASAHSLECLGWNGQPNPNSLLRHLKTCCQSLHWQPQLAGKSHLKQLAGKGHLKQLDRKGHLKPTCTGLTNVSGGCKSFHPWSYLEQQWGYASSSAWPSHLYTRTKCPLLDPASTAFPAHVHGTNASARASSNWHLGSHRAMQPAIPPLSQAHELPVYLTIHVAFHSPSTLDICAWL